MCRVRRAGPPLPTAAGDMCAWGLTSANDGGGLQILFGADTLAVISKGFPDPEPGGHQAEGGAGGPRATVWVLTAVLCPTRLPGPQTWGSRPPRPLPPGPATTEMSSLVSPVTRAKGPRWTSKGGSGERSRRGGVGGGEEFAGGVGAEPEAEPGVWWRGGAKIPRTGPGAGRGRGGARSPGAGRGEESVGGAMGRGGALQVGPRHRRGQQEIQHTPCWPHSMLNVGPSRPQVFGGRRRRQEGGHGAVAVHPGGLPRTARLSLVPLILLRLLPPASVVPPPQRPCSGPLGDCPHRRRPCYGHTEGSVPAADRPCWTLNFQCDGP